MWSFHIVAIFIGIFSIVYCNISQVPESVPAVDQSLNYRLPNDSRPLHYDLYIETDIHNGSDKFVGLARIYVEIIKATDVITMHFSNSTMIINNIDFYNFEGELN